jgi:hypothetical protein
VKKKLNFGKTQMKNEQHNERKKANDLLVVDEVVVTVEGDATIEVVVAAAEVVMVVDKNENVIKVSLDSYSFDETKLTFFILGQDDDGSNDAGESTETLNLKKTKGTSAD